jgi:hypothetical protein
MKTITIDKAYLEAELTTTFTDEQYEKVITYLEFPLIEFIRDEIDYFLDNQE